MNSANYPNPSKTPQGQPVLLNSRNQAFVEGRSRYLDPLFLVIMLIIGLSNIIFFSACLYIGLSSFLTEKELDEKGITTQAVVTKLSESGSGSRLTLFMEYSWTAPDPATKQPTQYRRTDQIDGSTYANYRVGDSITIRYLAAQPSEARPYSPALPKSGFNRLLIIILGIFAFFELVGLGFVVNGILSWRRQQELAANGQRLTGTVLRVERSFIWAAILVVHYSFTSPQTGLVLQGKRACYRWEVRRLVNLFGKGAAQLVNQPVYVLYLNDKKFMAL